MFSLMALCRNRKEQCLEELAILESRLAALVSASCCKKKNHLLIEAIHFKLSNTESMNAVGRPRGAPVTSAPPLRPRSRSFVPRLWQRKPSSKSSR